MPEKEPAIKSIKRYIAYLKADERAEGTISLYKQRFRDFRHFFKGKPLGSLTEDDLNRYFAKKRAQMEEKTVVNYKAIIKTFYKWFNGGEYPDCVKNIKVKRVVKKKDPSEILTPEEVYELIKTAGNERDRALIHLLYETGARIDEISKLNVKDIEFETKHNVETGEDFPIARVYFRPEITKNKTGRRVFLIDSVLALQQWKEKHPNPAPDQPLFVALHSHHGERWSKSAIRWMLKRVAQECGIDKPVNPHNFRHSRYTEDRKHHTAATVRKKFGHAHSSRIEEVYDHITDGDVEQAELESRGLVMPKDKRRLKLVPTRCMRCGNVYPAGRKFCECGRPLDHEIAKQWDAEQLKKDDAIAQLRKEMKKRDEAIEITQVEFYELALEVKHLQEELAELKRKT